MKLKVPFINFKNYVVLKCYTSNAQVATAFPITAASEIPPIKSKGNYPSTFRTCTGRVATLKTSASLPMWVSVEISSDSGTVNVVKSDETPNLCELDWSHNDDPYVSLDRMAILRLNTPWWLEEDTGIDFVVAANIMNPTQMHTPSGVANFKWQHDLNLFNYIRTEVKNSYTVIAGTPVLSLYPLTDKKLYVESYYDVGKTDYLATKTTTRAFFGNHAARVKKALCSVK